MQDVLKKFGQMVRIARAKKGYTQVELAEKLHTTDRTVSKIECGQTNPSLDTVCVCQQKSYANGHEKVVQCQHGQIF